MSSMRNCILSATGWVAAGILLTGASGCQVHVEKSANGQDKNVRVDTPFGGVHVNTDHTSAADLGLPAYPGAQVVPDKDNDKSADIHMGFGQWELRVKTVNYSTPDSQDKVEDFYKKALGRFGDVIVCQDDNPVGKPTSTSEGLSCQEHGKNEARIQVGDSDNSAHGHDGLQLKAGSLRYQHIVGFETPADGQTRFALVSIELPAMLDGGSGKKD